MDLGATICTPNRPACALCPWMAPCEARAEGVQAEYPKKEKRAPGIVRRGAAFVVLRSDDTILLRTRPPKGLLGSMAEVPTSVWEPDYEPSRAMLDAPIEARWQRLPGLVRHVFTHFPLELTAFSPGRRREPSRRTACALRHAKGFTRKRCPARCARCRSTPWGNPLHRHPGARRRREPGTHRRRRMRTKRATRRSFFERQVVMGSGRRCAAPE